VAAAEVAAVVEAAAVEAAVEAATAVVAAAVKALAVGGFVERGLIEVDINVAAGKKIRNIEKNLIQSGNDFIHIFIFLNTGDKLYCFEK